MIHFSETERKSNRKLTTIGDHLSFQDKNHALKCWRRGVWTRPHGLSLTHPCLSRANRTPGYPDNGLGLDPCFAVFGVFVNFLANFPHVKTMAKKTFFQLVSRATSATHRSRFWTLHWPVMTPRWSANFSPPLQAVWSARVTAPHSVFPC